MEVSTLSLIFFLYIFSLSLFSHFLSTGWSPPPVDTVPPETLGRHLRNLSSYTRGLLAQHMTTPQQRALLEKITDWHAFRTALVQSVEEQMEKFNPEGLVPAFPTIQSLRQCPDRSA